MINISNIVTWKRPETQEAASSQLHCLKKCCPRSYKQQGDIISREPITQESMGSLKILAFPNAAKNLQGIMGTSSLFHITPSPQPTTNRNLKHRWASNVKLNQSAVGISLASGWHGIGNSPVLHIHKPVHFCHCMEARVPPLRSCSQEERKCTPY